MDRNNIFLCLESNCYCQRHTFDYQNDLTTNFYFLISNLIEMLFEMARGCQKTLAHLIITWSSVLQDFDLIKMRSVRID